MDPVIHKHIDLRFATECHGCALLTADHIFEENYELRSAHARLVAAARDHGLCSCEGGPRPIGDGRFYHYIGCDNDPVLRAALASEEER